MAACSAISRTRSATDRGSMTAYSQVANLRYLSPKRKSGPKPTGQIRRSEQAVDYTRRIGRKQARARTTAESVSNRRSAEQVLLGGDGQPFLKPRSFGFPEGLSDRASFARFQIVRCAECRSSANHGLTLGA